MYIGKRVSGSILVIAMAFGILGTVAGETVINNAECVSKTFPQFWDILKSIGGKVEIDG